MSPMESILETQQQLLELEGDVRCDLVFVREPACSPTGSFTNAALPNIAFITNRGGSVLALRFWIRQLGTLMFYPSEVKHHVRTRYDHRGTAEIETFEDVVIYRAANGLTGDVAERHYLDLKTELLDRLCYVERGAYIYPRYR